MGSCSRLKSSLLNAAKASRVGQNIVSEEFIICEISRLVIRAWRKKRKQSLESQEVDMAMSSVKSLMSGGGIGKSTT